MLHLPGGRRTLRAEALGGEETPTRSQAGLCTATLSSCSENRWQEGHHAHGRAAQSTDLTLTHQLCNQGSLTNLSVPPFPQL